MNSKLFHTKNVLVISVTHLIHDIYTSFLAPIMPLLIKNLSISYTAAGFFPVILKIPTLFNPVIGVIADRVGIRYFLIAAPSLSAVAMSLTGVMNNYYGIMLLLLITGIGSSFFHVPAPVIVRRLSHREIGRGMSYYMLGGEIARTVGPLLILSVIAVWGFDKSYFLMPLGIISSVILYFILRDKQFHLSKKNKTSKHKISDVFHQHRKLLVGIGLFLLFRSFMKVALTTFLPTFLNSKGNSVLSAGILLSLLQLSGVGGTYFSGVLSDRIGKKKTLLASSFIVAVSFLLLIFNTEQIFELPILIISGLALFASTPILLALVNQTDSKSPAFINSVYMTMSFLITVGANISIGFFADLFGFNAVYCSSAVLAFLAVPCILFIPNKN